MLFDLRWLLGLPGVALLLWSGILLGTSDFGSAPFLLGLTLHLVGQACCLGMLCLPAWWSAQWRRRREQVWPTSALPPVAGSIRSAHFRVEVQAVRLLYGSALVFVLLGGLTFGAVGLRNLLLLRMQGVVTTAAITGTTFREAGPLLVVTYSFPTPRGLPVVDTFRAPRHALPALQTGSTLRVTYLPSNPDVHAWQRVNNAWLARGVVSGVLLLTLLLAYTGFPLYLIERRLRAQLRLGRVGVAVTGTIVACRPLLRRSPQRGYALTYRFTTSTRHVYGGRALVPHVAGEPTLPGFPITVLYDPLLPALHLPLAAFYVVQMPVVHPTVLAA